MPCAPVILAFQHAVDTGIPTLSVRIGQYGCAARGRGPFDLAILSVRAGGDTRPRDPVMLADCVCMRVGGIMCFRYPFAFSYCGGILW